MKSKYLGALLLAGSLMMAPAAQAAGLLLIDPVGGVPVGPGIVPIIPGHPIHPLPGHPTPPPGRILLKGGVSFGLHMQSADVKVDITDQVARTYITQTFVNDTDRNLAGTYLFPLPDDTTFSSFSLHIDGRPVEGKILEAQEARQQYEQIVRSMVDPGLLEYADYKTVRARIFPIPAHGTKKVELEYTQVLKAENGMLKYRFPLKSENDTAPSDELKVSVKLSSKQGLRTIWSPSHTIAMNKTDDHTAKVAYLEKETVPDKDFLLYYSVSDKDMAANLLTHKTTGEDGYYMLTVTPPVEAKQVINKDIVLVADTSGSMAGERMDENKKALRFLVNALNAGDRFNIVQFNTDVEQFKDGLVTATPANKKAALGFIDDLEAHGGTNMGDALRNAVTMLGTTGDRPGYLVLMTDGEPTVGDTSQQSILKIADSKRDIRVFDFGVGYDVNTRLLNKLAETHHGTAQYIEPDESIETALSSFYQKIKTPVLTNVKIAYDGVQVKDVYPREVKDIFAGSQILLIGKYKGSGSGTVRITGTVNGVAKAYSFPLSFAAEQSSNTYLPRLWAMRRIGHLTEVAQENGDSREVVDEIVALSKKYGIISQYTSFLVTDPNERNAHGMPVGMPVGMPMRSPRPMPVAMGTGFSGLASGGGGGAPGGMVRNRRLAMHNESARFATAPMSTGMMPPQPMAITDSAAAASFDRSATRRLEDNKVALKKASLAQTIYGDEGTVRDGEFLQSWSGSRAAFQNAPTSGKQAVLREKAMSNFKDALSLADKKETAGLKTVEDKTFFLHGGFWTDSAYDGHQQLQTISFGSKEYFDLLKTPGLGKFLSVGRQVILIFQGHGYKITFNATA
ncbi:MAG TPA: VIT domain-containing protein [Candidatus Obscuribacterales bacterium]